MSEPINPGTNPCRLYNHASKEKGQFLCVAETGVLGSFRLTAGSFAASAQGDYFTFQVRGGATYAAWLDKDADGTAPSGAAYTAATNKIKVSISTGDSATVVAGAIASALAAVTMTITDNSNGTLDFAQTTMGTHAVPGKHNTGDTGNGSLATSLVIAGVASNNNSTYWLLSSSDGTGYYVWYNVNSEGVDPAPAGKTAIPVLVAIGASGATIATSTKTAIDLKSKFTTTRSTATLTMVDLANGDAADIGAGTSVGSASQLIQGANAQITAATEVDSISNNPSAIVD